MRNLCFDVIKRRKIEMRERDAEPPFWSIPRAVETPEEQVRQNRLGAEIERRMASLAPWQRDVFRLRHVEDLPIEEISRRTTRSEDAVRSGLYRTKRLLFDAADVRGDDE